MAERIKQFEALLPMKLFTYDEWITIIHDAAINLNIDPHWEVIPSEEDKDDQGICSEKFLLAIRERLKANAVELYVGEKSIFS